jgi:hypothetical protein
MSNLSSALVVRDSLLPPKGTDLLRDHSADFIAASTFPNSEYQSGAARGVSMPHVNKLPDMHGGAELLVCSVTDLIIRYKRQY